MKSLVASFGRITFVAVAILLTGHSVNAQVSTMTAQVLAPSKKSVPIVINKTSNWEFGFLFTGSTPGTATISTGNVLTSAGGITPMASSAATPSAAAFTITGDNSAVYSIVFPSSMTLTRRGGTEKLTLDAFTKTGSGVLVNGSEKIVIGATLHIGALQPSGSYVGTNYITVVYN